MLLLPKPIGGSLRTFWGRATRSLARRWLAFASELLRLSWLCCPRLERPENQRETKRISERKSATAAEGPARPTKVYRARQHLTKLPPERGEANGMKTQPHLL